MPYLVIIALLALNFYSGYRYCEKYCEHKTQSVYDGQLDFSATFNAGWKDESMPEITQIGTVVLLDKGKIGMQGWNMDMHNLGWDDERIIRFAVASYVNELFKRTEQSLKDKSYPPIRRNHDKKKLEFDVGLPLWDNDRDMRAIVVGFKSGRAQSAAAK